MIFVGAGYHLIFVKQGNCDVQKIMDVVVKFVPDTHMKSNVGLELSFILPFESKANFEGLFAMLDDQKEQLRFSSYGVSITTMEEVFLRYSRIQLRGAGLYSLLIKNVNIHLILVDFTYNLMKHTGT